MSQQADRYFMATWLGGDGIGFWVKIEQGKFPRPVPGRRCQASRPLPRVTGSRPALSANYKADRVEFPFRGRPFPRQKTEEHGMADIIGRALIVTVDGKKGRVELPGRLIVVKKDLKGLNSCN